jgi:hypothetical protein
MVLLTVAIAGSHSIGLTRISAYLLRTNPVVRSSSTIGRPSS